MKNINERLTVELIDQEPSMAYLYDLYQTKAEFNIDNFYNIYKDENNYTEYEQFNDVVLYEKKELQKLYDQHKKLKIKDFSQMCTSTIQNLFDYDQHLKNFKKQIIQEGQQKDYFNMQISDLIGQGKFYVETQFQFPNISGRNPSSWPQKLDEFIQNLLKLPYYCLFEQPMKLNHDYFPKVENKILELTKNINDKPLNDSDFNFLTNLILVDFLSSLLKGSFSKFLKAIQKSINILPHITAQQNIILTSHLQKNLSSLMKELIYSLDKRIFDFHPVTYQIDRKFALNDVKIFDFLLPSQEYCFTTDGTYIYELINNSGKLLFKKFGTGKNGTKQGTIYYTRSYQSNLKSNLSIVYYQNKLYVNNNLQRGTLQVYSPENFDKFENINLNLESYFKNPHLNQYNQNAKIFTDGKYIYMILLKVVQIKKEKKEQKNDEKQENKDQKEQQDQKDKKDDQKEEKKDDQKEEKKEEQQKEDQQKKDDKIEDNEEEEEDEEEEEEEEDEEEEEEEWKVQNQEPEKKQLIEKKDEPQKLTEEKEFKYESPKNQKKIGIKKKPKIKKIKKIDDKVNIKFQTMFDARDNEFFIKPQQQQTLNKQNEEDESYSDTISSNEEEKYILEQQQNDINMFMQLRRMNKPSDKIDPGKLRFNNSFAQKMQGFKQPIKDNDPLFYLWDKEDIGLSDQKLIEKQILQQEIDFCKKQINQRVQRFNQQNTQQELTPDTPNETNDQQKMMESLRSINIIKNIIKTQHNIQPQEKVSLMNRMMNSNPFRKRRLDGIEDENFANIFEHEMMYISSQRLEQLKKKKVTTNPPVQNNNQDQFKIEFYLVKFDFNEQQIQQKKDLEKFQKNNDIHELYESFNQLFSFHDCGYAYYQNDQDIQQAAQYLIKKHSENKLFMIYEPVQETLIYQTFSENSLDKNSPVKLIAVKKNSILLPQDIYGKWFVRGNSLLKSTGQLFSTDSQDQISIPFEELQNSGQDIFSERRNSKLHQILQEQDLDPEYVDVLYKQLYDEAEEHKLKEFFLIRNVSKESEQVDKSNDITTTFIKTYQGTFFKQGAYVDVCYDNQNKNFLVMNFQKIPKTSNNFIKQVVYFLNDNNKELEHLHNLIPLEKEKIISPMLYYLDFIKVQDFKELIISLVNFSLWININRPLVRKRINNWELILNHRIENLDEKTKKKQSSFKNKIKKLKDKKIRSFKNEIISWIPQDKLSNVRSLEFTYHMCLKGNAQNLLLLYQIFDQDIIPEIKPQIQDFFKLFSLYHDFKMKKMHLEIFENKIFEKMKNNDLINNKLIVQMSPVLSLDLEFFKKLIQDTYENNKELFIQIIKEIFKPILDIQNLNQFNQKIFLELDQNNDTKSSNSIMQLSYKENIMNIIQTIFIQSVDQLEKLFELMKLAKQNDKEIILQIIRKLIEFMLIKNLKKSKNQQENEELKQKLQQFKIKKQKIFDFIIKTCETILQTIDFEKQSYRFKEEFIYLANFIPYFLIPKKIKESKDPKDPKELSQVLSSLLNILQCFKQYSLGQKIDMSRQILETFEGVSQLNVFLAETPHPIERGKNMKFKNIVIPNCFGFLVEFDKNCQDEENSDQLVFNSWYNNQPKGSFTNVNNSYLSKNFIINFREKSQSKTVVMIGDSLSIKFTSSLVARQNLKSLSQWGYKLLIRPIFINSDIIKKNINLTQETYYLKGLFTLMEKISICIRSILSYFIKGQQKGQKTEFKNILKWKLLHSGLSYLGSDKFLEKNDKNDYFIKKEMIFDKKSQNQQNESEVQSIVHQSKINDKISLGDFQEYDFQELIKMSEEKESPIYGLIQVIQELVPESMFFRMEKTRHYFLPELQVKWKQIENLIMLCYIKHNNLVQLAKNSQKQDLSFLVNDKNIKEILNEIGKKRNNVIGFMLKELEMEKEYQNLITYIFECIKENCVEKYIKKRIENEINEIKKATEKKLTKKQMIQNLIKKRQSKKKKKQKDTPSISKKSHKQDHGKQHHYITLEEFEELTKNKNISNHLLQIIQDQYENKEEKLQRLFDRQKLTYTREQKVNYQFLLNFILEKIKMNIISNNKQTEKYSLEIKQINPYLIVVDKMQLRCEFLLRIDTKNNFKDENLIANLEPLKLQKEVSIPQNLVALKIKEEGEELLTPIPIHRSLTSDSRNKKKSNKKTKNFESWIESYKNWKSMMTDKHEDLQSDNCSSTFAVTEFLCQQTTLQIKKLEDQFLIASNTAALRVIGLQNLNKVFDLVKGTWLEKYFDITNSSIYKELNIFQNIFIANKHFKTIIFNYCEKLVDYKLNDFISKVKELKKIKNFQFFEEKTNICNNDSISFDESVFQINSFLTKLLYNQIEIFTLINNQNYREKIQNFSQIEIKNMVEFLELNLELNLLCLNTQKLSFDFRQTVIIIRKLQTINELIFNEFLRNFDQNQMFEILVKIFKKEIGFIDKNVYGYHLYSSLDIVKKTRIKFLLISLNQIDDKELLQKKELAQILCLLLNYNQDVFINESSLLLLQKISKNNDLLIEKNIFEEIKQKKLELSQEEKALLKNQQIPIAEKQKLLNSKELITKKFPLIGENIMEFTLNQIGKQLIIEKEENQNAQYQIMCHFQNEQGLMALIRLFYLWERENPSFSQKYPVTMRQYQEQKKIVIQKNEKIIKNNTEQKKTTKILDDIQIKSKQRFQENILLNIPEVQFDIENNLGWQFQFNQYFEEFKSNTQKPKEIFVKQVKSFLNIKTIEAYINILSENLSQLQMPGEKQIKEQRKQLQKERITDWFDDGYGYCIDLLFEEWKNLEEKEKQIEQNLKEELEKIENLKKQQTKQPSNMKSLKEKILQKKQDLLQKNHPNQIIYKFEKTKSQDLSRKKKLPRKQSEFVVQQKKQEEDFLATYRFLKTLIEITKNVLHIGQFLNFMGQSVVVIQSKYLTDKKSKIQNFAKLFEYLVEDRIIKIDYKQYIQDGKMQQNLKNFFQSINQKPQKNEFVYSVLRKNFAEQYNESINFINKLQVNNEDLCKYINKISFINYKNKLSLGKSAKIRSLQKFILNSINNNQNIQQYINDKQMEFLQANDININELNLALCVLNLDWKNEYVCGEIVSDQNNEKICILSNQRNSGKSDNQGIKINEKPTIIKLDKKLKMNYKENNDQLLTFYQQNISLLYNKIKLFLPIYNEEINEETNLNNKFKEKIVSLSLLIILQKLLEKNENVLNSEFEKIFMDMINEIFETGKHLKNQFFIKTERLMDSILNTNFIIPHDHQNPQNYSFIQEIPLKKKTSVQIEQKKANLHQEQKTFTLTKSSHMQGIQKAKPKVVEYKMLKYWEKHIIPKIHNFVKGTLSQFEVEEFTEQMRIELRKNNFSQASNIAYILCDQKLPTNCYLPGLNYDWNTLNLDEIQIGQWVQIKIKDERNLYSIFLQEFQKLDIRTVMGLVIQKNHTMDAINVLIQDRSLQQQFSIWVPQQAVRPIDNTLELPANFFNKRKLFQQFDNAFKNYTNGVLRKILIKNLKKENLDFKQEKLFQNFKTSVQYVLKGDCLNQWLVINKSYISNKPLNPVLKTFLEKITNQNNLGYFLEILKKDVENLVQYFKSESYHCDLQKTFKDQFQNIIDDKIEGKYSNLNIFENKTQINGIIIEFETLSNLFKCSGLKFFNDAKGVHMIKHLQASQQHSLYELEPLIFNQSDVYYQFYFNKEALPPYISSSTTTQLQAYIYAIPYSWNYIMWCIDSLSTYSLQQSDEKIMFEISKIFLHFFKIFHGPTCVLKYIYELFCRLLIKIRELNKKQKISQDLKKLFCKENFNIQEVFNHYELFKRSKQDNELTSNLVQQIMEFLSIFFVNCLDFDLDQEIDKNYEKLGQISEIFQLSEFLQNPQHKSQFVSKLLFDILNPTNYFNNFFLIENIPNLSQESVQKLIYDTLEQHKFKILIPHLDVYIPCDSDNNCVGFSVILYDGFKPLSQEDIKEDEETEEIEQPPQIDRQWQCDRCTLLNPDNTDVCLVCEAPKPANPVYPNEEIQQEEKQEINKKDISYRIEYFKNQLISEFERLTPDKRIKIQSFEGKLNQLKESNEIIEFLMVRITSENFQNVLKKISEIIYKENENSLKELKILNPNELYDYLNSQEPFELFNMLSNYGYDFWLEKICSKDQNFVSSKDLSDFQEFFKVLYSEVDDLNAYLPQNFRLEYKNQLRDLQLYDNDLIKKIKYNETKEFYYKMMKFNQYSNFEIKCTLAAIYQLNKLLNENFEDLIIHQAHLISNHQQQLSLDLGSMLFNIRDYFCTSFKNKMSQVLLEKTASDRDSTPKIIIERITKEKQILHDPKDSKNQKLKLYDDKKYTFLQAFNQIIQLSSSQLRPHKPKGNDSFICFEIQFKGEHVMGESGPYRQFFADIINELQTKDQGKKKLDLLIPTPNQLSELGDYKDKYTINPSCKTQHHLKLFEFLGLLMGCAFRTEIYLSLDLPQIFWKKMVNEKILEQDIEELDKGVHQLVRFVKNCNEEDFEHSLFENYSTYLSDRTEVELIPNGKNIKVTHDNRLDFIQKLLQVRLSETDIQIQAIKKGFSKIVPLVLLTCLNAKDLEQKVCGEKEVDFGLLKKNTKYSGNLSEDQQLIKNFWEILFELNDKDKLLFVKFCWGQERLPSTLQAYQSRSTRFMIKPSQYSGNQDGILPRADTCFFNFELPNYSSKEIMKERILLAIHTDCDSMNAEEKQEDNNQQNQSYEMIQHQDDFFD